MTQNNETHIINLTNADDALREIRSLGRRIVTFFGFSSAGYEDETAIARLLSGMLAELNPATDIICSGATPMGIGIVYQLAKSPRRFQTIGIVSSAAQKERIAFADNVDTVFVIEDDTWGGYVDNGKTLSPTSKVMVEASDMFIFIGGGAIARDEFDYVTHTLGAPAHFEAADMNHAVAIEKARSKGGPAPTDFKGAIYAYVTEQGR